jgi:hypothetical protein
MAQLIDWMEWFGEEVVRRFRTKEGGVPKSR